MAEAKRMQVKDRLSRTGLNEIKREKGALQLQLTSWFNIQ